jgi:hypothetical protein
MDQNPPPPWSPTPPPPPEPHNAGGPTASPPPPPDPSTAWGSGALASQATPPPPPTSAVGAPASQPAPPTQPGQYGVPPNAFQTPPSPNGPKKPAWLIPAAIGAAIGLVGIAAFFALFGKTDKKSSTSTTTTINSMSTPTTEAPTTVRPRLTTTVADSAPDTTEPGTPTTSPGAAGATPGMTSLQFAGLKSVIKQLAQVDIAPYEECVRDTPYGTQMTDATLLVCIEDPAVRLQYIRAALGRSSALENAPPDYLACYETAVTSDEFITRIANPVGTGSDADAWAIDQFTAAGLTCAKAN